MVRWMQAAGLAVVLALGESCGLKSVPVPRLEVGQALQDRVETFDVSRRPVAGALAELRPISADGSVGSASGRASPPSS